MKRVYDDRERTSDCGSSKRKKLPSFYVWPRNQFERNFPKFSPKEIGNFSLNERREFVHNDSKLRFFYQPTNVRDANNECGPDKMTDELALNLREGYNIFIQRDESVKDHLDDLLRWILVNKQKFDCSSQNRVSMDFVCWRGLLTKILCTPYENREGWRIAAARYKNCIYLCEFDTQQKVEDKERETAQQKEMTYWGLKFEQYVTAGTMDGVPNTKRPVDSNEAYVSVVQTRLNNHSLVFGGEVDCREGSEYVELKTSREITNTNQHRNFKRFKLIKWWAQSFLIRIPKVICGFRDDDGVVRSLEVFKTADIPRYCQDIDDCWKGTVCFNFCDDLLKFIKDSVKEDYNNSVYVFEWMPRQPATCRLEKPDSEYAFIPHWFTEKFEPSG